MTKEIDEMPVGREIDGLVAKQLMGWRTVPVENPLDLRNKEAWVHGDVEITVHTEKRHSVSDASKSYVIAGAPPAFSVDVKAAWMVVDKVLVMLPGSTFHLNYWRLGRVAAEFTRAGDVERKYAAEAPAVALAICRAALKLVVVQEKSA